MDNDMLTEKIYPVENNTELLKTGDIITVDNIKLKLGDFLLPAWRFAYTEDGEELLYYKGNCNLWENILRYTGKNDKYSILPDILVCSESEAVIKNKKEYEQYNFASHSVQPLAKKDIDENIKHLLNIAEFIKNLNETGLSVLYINPDSIYKYNEELKLKILPDICEINKKMYSPKDMVAPEVLRHEYATGKEGVYILGLLTVKFFTGKNLYPYDDISVFDFILNVNIAVPGFPQLLSKTLVQSEERFAPEEAFYYLKYISDERKISVKYDIGTSSTVGLNKYRLMDEDSCGYVMKNTLNYKGKNLLIKACLADGIGGLAAGELASKAAIDGFLKTDAGAFPASDSFNDNDIDINELALNLAWQANKNVFDSLGGKVGGCTFIGVIIENETFALAHVGDSRAYLWTGSEQKPELKRLTNDHSYVALMVSSGNMTEEQAKKSPERNKILRSLGTIRNRRENYIDDLSLTTGKKSANLKNNDILIIICDGIWSEIEHEELIEILNSPGCRSADMLCAQNVAAQLVDLAVRKGAPDNASALVIKRIS
jgi:protein phosphatase